MEEKFKTPRVIQIGGNNGIKKIYIGGKNPVTVQTMWKESITEIDNSRLDSIIKRIDSLKSLGCDIVRFAVPDMESAHSLCKIAGNTDVPLVADIHFDYRLALECLKGNISVIRINPGNIGTGNSKCPRDFSLGQFLISSDSISSPNDKCFSLA